MVKEELIIKVTADVVEAQRRLSKVRKDINKTSRITKQGNIRLAKAQREVIKRQEKLNNVIGKSNVQFAGYALSLMFAGMALQRLFGTIIKVGLKAFNEVTASVEGSVTASTKLAGSMKFMGFLIGEALQPIIAWLVPIVEWISDWIEENQSLTAGILVMGAAIGTALMVGGMLKLAIDGFVSLKGIILGTTVATEGATAATTAYGAAWARLGILTMVGGLILVTIWLDKLKTAMGGWGEFFKNVLRGILRVTGIVDAVIAGTISEIGNLLKMTWNGIVNLVQGAINLMIKVANRLRGVLGMDKIAEVDFSGAKFQRQDLGDAFMQTYIDRMVANEQKLKDVLGDPKTGFAVGGGIVPEFGGGGGDTINIQNVNVENPKDLEDFLEQIKLQQGKSLGVSVLQ